MRNRMQWLLFNPDPPAGGGGDPTAGGEAIKQAIEKARLEERERQRVALEKANAEKQQAQEAAKQAEADREKLTRQVTELTSTVAALQAGSKAEGGVDVAKAIESAVDAALKRHGTELGKEISQLKKELAQERNLRQQAEATQLRVRLIAEAGGADALIPELVQGETEEQIKASIESSKGIFARTVAKIVPGGGTTTTSSGNPPTIPVPSTTGNPPVPAAGQRSDVRAMTTAEYAKQRSAIKAATLARFQQTAMT